MGTYLDNEGENDYTLRLVEEEASHTICRRVAVAGSVLPALIGLLSLLGWVLGCHVLASLRTNFIPMAPSTALVFLLLTTTLKAQVCVPASRFCKIYGLVSGAVVLAVSAGILVEFFARVPSGMERFLLSNPGHFDGVLIGRMSPITALAFLLADVALLLRLQSTAFQDRLRTWSAGFASLVVMVMIVVIIGYLYGTPLLYGATIIPVALPTAIAFLFLGVGLLAHAGPLCFPLRAFVGSSSQAQLLRAFLPLSMIGCLASGLIDRIASSEIHLNPALLGALSVLVTGLVVSLLASRMVHTLGSALDRAQAERKQALEDLERISQQNRLILNAAAEGIYGLDQKGRPTFINPAAARMIGWEAQELLGKSVHARVHHTKADGSPYPEEECPLAATVKEGVSLHIEEELFWRKDGTSFPVELNSTPIRDETGQIVGAVVTFRDITSRKQAQEQLQRQFERLMALRAIDVAILASLDLRLTLGIVLDQVAIGLGNHAACILLFDPDTQMLEYAAGRGFKTQGITRSRLRLGEGYAGRTALERSTVSIPDLKQAEETWARADFIAGEGFVEYHAVPLTAKGDVKGVLEVYHREPLPMDADWLEFLEALAGQAAIAVDNAMLFEDLKRSNAELVVAYDTTLEGWVKALDLRDHETEGHTQRVTEMTLRLAQAMGMKGSELVSVRRGALLHDIGKIGIPDPILLKPGPLTEAEWEVMRKHPVYAYEWLSPIAYLRPALAIPYCHHEKWDGTGYPRGLKGEQIPLEARIFAVVDVWDALCSDRPYRQGWPQERVIEHIRSLAGTHFDPQMVETFLKVITEDTQQADRDIKKAA